MKKITFLCTLLVAAAGVMLSPSFNPQPDPRESHPPRLPYLPSIRNQIHQALVKEVNRTFPASGLFLYSNNRS